VTCGEILKRIRLVVSRWRFSSLPCDWRWDYRRGRKAGTALRRVLVGVYLLFSIKVADQWEKVAVLARAYIGLRGPGLFHVIPIVDRLSRYVDQNSVASVTAESTLTRHRTGECGCIVFWLVWNAENRSWKLRILFRRSL
jgi:hypothetical protein